MCFGLCLWPLVLSLSPVSGTDLSDHRWFKKKPKKRVYHWFRVNFLFISLSESEAC